jgi:hypothetical protein
MVAAAVRWSCLLKLSGMVAALVLVLTIATEGAGAQASSHVYRVGLLSVAADPTGQSRFGAGLGRGFVRQRFILGKNLVFERRATRGQAA